MGACLTPATPFSRVRTPRCAAIAGGTDPSSRWGLQRAATPRLVCGTGGPLVVDGARSLARAAAPVVRATARAANMRWRAGEVGYFDPSGRRHCHPHYATSEQTTGKPRAGNPRYASHSMSSSIVHLTLESSDIALVASECAADPPDEGDSGAYGTTVALNAFARGSTG